MSGPGIEHWLSPDNDGRRYSSAVRSGGMIFVSGHLGTTPGAEPTSFEDQLRAALAGLLAAVEALGGDRSTILKVNGYLARLEDFPDYHRVYAEIFDGVALPARTTVQIAGFEPPVLVELDAVAAVRG